jgi:predicted metal-dependent hydrolase
MGIVEDAFSRIFPSIEFQYEASIDYSGKFKPFNATVRKRGSQLEFNLSRSWETVSEEIKIGLIQSLLVKILRRDKSIAPAGEKARKSPSFNMQLYDDFIKGMSDSAEAVESGDEQLNASFSRVNQTYFLGLMDRPNLKWGSDSFRKLACFEYHTNTISVSNLFQGAPEHLLDYLMYHELLHKKLKFSSSNGRTSHHGTKFREEEARFEGWKSINSGLNAYLRGQKRVRRGFSWRSFLFQ